MRFGLLPLAEARGAILAHTLRAGELVLKKGRRLGDDDLAALAVVGVERVMAAQLDADDVGEDAVAAAVARAFAGPGMRVAPAKTGRANLFAAENGILQLDAARIDALNLVDESVTVATLPAEARVQAGEMVATVKVIPFAVPGTTLARCLAAIAPEGASPASAVRPFRALRVGLVLTRLGGQPEARLEQGARALGERVHALGWTLTHELRCAHETGAVSEALRELAADAPDVVLVLGASAIVDRQDVIPAALRAAGGSVEHFGMPVDPGNLILLGRYAGRPVIGVPSCARSPKRSGFDLVLERLAAGLPCGAPEVMRLGVGGLLPDIASRPASREGEAEDETRRERPAIAAIVLAGGSSRRMGARNKLLVPIDGEPMVARTVDSLRALPLAEVIVVTGHQAGEVAAALAGRPLRLVHNAEHELGLASSLKAGIRALADDVDGVLVCLGDMPWVRPETLKALVAAFAPESGAAICTPVFEGKRGNPVLWARRFFGAMLGMSGDTGAKELLARHAEEVAAVAVPDPGVLLDVDTEEALRARADQAR